LLPPFPLFPSSPHTPSAETAVLFISRSRTRYATGSRDSRTTENEEALICRSFQAGKKQHRSPPPPPSSSLFLVQATFPSSALGGSLRDRKLDLHVGGEGGRGFCKTEGKLSNEKGEARKKEEHTIVALVATDPHHSLDRSDLAAFAGNPCNDAVLSDLADHGGGEVGVEGLAGLCLYERGGREGEKEGASVSSRKERKERIWRTHCSSTPDDDRQACTPQRDGRP
jgi:hypothetical protein